MNDSGLAAAMTAGLVVGNMRVHRMNELAEFKEQLTTLLVGTLFILLAADVRIADVTSLGKPALIVVALLMFVVRPLEMIACTFHAGMGWRERLYMSGSLRAASSPPRSHRCSPSTCARPGSPAARRCVRSCSWSSP